MTLDDLDVKLNPANDVERCDPARSINSHASLSAYHFLPA